MVNNMDKEFIIQVKVKLKKENGRKERELNGLEDMLLLPIIMIHKMTTE